MTLDALIEALLEVRLLMPSSGSADVVLYVPVNEWDGDGRAWREVRPSDVTYESAHVVIEAD